MTDILEPTTNQELDTSRVVGGAGVYPFVQNLVLGVRNEGLGTTLTTVLVPVEGQARKLLRIPDGYRIAAHLAVGWPEAPLPTRLSRRPVHDFATCDYFDGSQWATPAPWPWRRGSGPVGLISPSGDVTGHLR